MGNISTRTGVFALVALAAVPLSTGLHAQAQDPNITVTGTAPVDPASLTPGPEIKGVITARHGNKVQVATPDGTRTVIAVNETTRIKASSGLFGSRNTLDAGALLNGLPVDVKTLQAPDGLLASQISFRSADYKTTSMIRNATDQRFTEQSAATEALRGRMADIDKYNIKNTTNVYFASGKAMLSPEAMNQLCATATQAEGMDNALILVVGYTDSTGSDEVNQALSEKRAGTVTRYLQQACHWKPWRTLTPSGMATADPLADNSTPEGKAQNRRVAINVLVSKGLDGM